MGETGEDIPPPVVENPGRRAAFAGVLGGLKKAAEIFRTPNSADQSTLPPDDDKRSSRWRMGRRTFLKFAGLGAAALLTKFGYDKLTSKPEQENPQQESEHSQYFGIAINEIRKKHPEKEGQVRSILESVDRQGVENFTTYTASYDPGLRIPMTRVSAREAIGKTKPIPEGIAEDKRHKIHVVIGGISIPGFGNGSLFMPWDIVYDRVMNDIPMVARGVKADVITLGYPQDVAGKVSAEYVKGLSENPAATYSKLYGEVVAKLLEQNPDAHIVLHGMSTGSTIVELAARGISDEFRKRVQVLQDSPVADHGWYMSVIKAAQIPLGFMGEGSARGILDPRVGDSKKNETPFFNYLKKVMERKGIDYQDDDGQMYGKYMAFLSDVSTMAKGIPLDTEKIRSFIRRGIADPLSFPSAGLFDRVRQEGKAMKFGINSTHFINRFRVDKWARVIDNFLPQPGN